jgi:zinc D-Ala-D-Ala carboxypeptidase
MYRYFTDAEVAGLDPVFVWFLDKARHEAGVPFVLTETVAEGGSHVENSAHGRGLAVDIRCRDSHTRFRILRGLLHVGFNRIGIYDRHCHVDYDSSLPQQVAWLGVSH